MVEREEIKTKEGLAVAVLDGDAKHGVVLSFDLRDSERSLDTLLDFIEERFGSLELIIPCRATKGRLDALRIRLGSSG